MPAVGSAGSFIAPAFLQPRTPALPLLLPSMRVLLVHETPTFVPTTVCHHRQVRKSSSPFPDDCPSTLSCCRASQQDNLDTRSTILLVPRDIETSPSAKSLPAELRSRQTRHSHGGWCVETSATSLARKRGDDSSAETIARRPRHIFPIFERAGLRRHAADCGIFSARLDGADSNYRAANRARWTGKARQTLLSSPASSVRTRALARR